MDTCPCCSNRLLRHIRHHHVYWFCPHCWQEMPNMDELALGFRHQYCCRLEALMAPSDQLMAKV